QLVDRLENADSLEEGELQAIPFDIARSAEMEPKDLFRLFYEVVLGQERGPRFGSFAKMVGVDKVREMVREKVEVGA
ncbi:MAG: lysyl-tRNA synthetase class 1, partial [Planctomycetota bacterium]